MFVFFYSSLKDKILKEYPIIFTMFLTATLKQINLFTFNISSNENNFQRFLLKWLNLHDSCGVNNLHGMPGIFAAFFSVFVCGIASEEVYGKRLVANR